MFDHVLSLALSTVFDLAFAVLPAAPLFAVKRLSSFAGPCPEQVQKSAQRKPGRHDCIKAFSETDFTEDLKKIDVPTLVMHGDDDQIVPYLDAGALSAKLVKNAQLKVYPGFPHGMPIIHADTLNPDLLAFIKA
jgi:pimeloyl-ACP methyl ester carboxylesterase